MGIERAVVKQVKYRDVRKHDIIGGEIACHENQCTYRNQNGKYQPNPCYDFFGGEVNWSFIGRKQSIAAGIRTINCINCAANFISYSVLSNVKVLY